MATTLTRTANVSGRILPNRRQMNPLADYPMVTYQLSLYMITPDSYDEFVATGKTTLPLASSSTDGKGAYLIAQSGGVNESESRADGFKLDYYIDNLVLDQAISPTESGTSAANTEISFTIIEPYGFSFITNLKKTAEQLKRYSNTLGLGSLANASKQLYVLGVKFLGYDGSGDLIEDTDEMIQRFWDIYIISIEYKLDGKAVQYSIKAAPINTYESFGTAKGRIDLTTTVKGSTVGEVLRGNGGDAIGLFPKLTQDQEKIPNLKFYNTYSVEFIGPDAEAIESAAIRPKSNTDKTTVPSSGVKTSTDVNVKQESNPPKLASVEFSFASCHILQAIQQVIGQSTYVTKALETIYKTEIEPNSSDKREVVNQTSETKLKWYNVSAEVSEPKFDDITSTFAYHITYYIRSYDIPAVIIPNANSVTNYYGPVKKYQYWFSGKNSEIIKYEQKLDNSYYVTVLDPSPNNDLQNDAGVSFSPQKRQDEQRNGLPIGPAAEQQNQIATQITDPGNYAHAIIEIMGDPDFLIQTGANGSETTFDLFYGSDGFSINPNGGQVFIEIDFKEAVDYDAKSGLMSVNDKILFWDYPPDVISSGISYRVNGVKSMFRGGKFTQILDCTINTFNTKSESTPDTESREGSPQNNSERQSTSSDQSITAHASDLMVDTSLTPSNINKKTVSTEYDS